MGLVCYPKWHLGLVGSAFFGGWASTILILPRVADIHGRKWVFISSVIVDTLMMIMMIFACHNINLCILYMFIAGMATSGRTTTGFIYAGEFFAPRWRIWFGTFFVALSGWTGLFITIYFDFIDRHWKNVCYFGLA